MQRQVQGTTRRCRAVLVYPGRNAGRIVRKRRGASRRSVPKGDHGRVGDAIVGWNGSFAPAGIAGQTQPEGSARLAGAVRHPKSVAQAQDNRFPGKLWIGHARNYSTGSPKGGKRSVCGIISAMVNADSSLRSQIVTCRRCVEAGYWVEAPPIVSGPATARLMVVGQAPGKVEASQTRRPFSGPAGKRLFRWFAEAGWTEDEFRSINYMTAITKCFPGPHPSGRGDPCGE